MTLLVLDRDGVINEDSDDFIRGLQDWQPIPGSLDAIAALSRAGYRVAIATNQSGLGRGLFTRQDLEDIHRHLRQAVERLGGKIAGIYYCPHLPDEGCDCRKPAPGMILRAAKEDSLDLRRSVLVGDKVSDIESGRAAGVGCCVLVLTGHPLGAADRNKADNVFAGLRDLAGAFASNKLCPGSIRS